MSLRTLLAGGLLAAAITAAPAQAAVPDNWVRWGGAHREATVRSLDFLGTLYAGTEDDGVFTSPTAIGPWTQMNTGLEAPGADSVRQVKAAPSGIVYAATTAGLFSSPSGSGAWSPVGQGPGERKLNMGGIQSIMFNDPSGADMTVAVAGAGGPGVYYSSDFGAHWDKAAGMPSGENVFFLTAHPAGTPMYAAADDGVFVSLDFGRSWKLMSDGIPPGETTLRVAVAPDDPTHLYAATSSGVYRFVKEDLSWAPAEGSDGQTLPAAGAKRAFILAPPLNGQFGQNRAVVGTQSGVYATIDDGASWGKMSATTAAPDGGTPMGDRVVWSLGLGFTTPALMAGTAGFGVFSLPLQPIEAGTVAITPSSGLQPGKTLTAWLSGWGGTKPYFFTYQWKKCQDLGAGCTPTTTIPGETGAEYTIPDDDANKSMKYSVTVIGRNLVRPGAVLATSAPVAASFGPLPGTLPRPAFGAGPSVSPSVGQQPTPKWGQVFTINNGLWRTEGSAAPIAPAFGYRWQRCDGNGANCVPIPAATGQTYTATPNDIGSRISGYVRGTHNGVPGDWWLAGGSNSIVNKHPVNTTAPKIVGDPITGVTLSSSAGGWDGHDMTFKRRWLRCEADGLGCNPVVPAQTGTTYQLTAADRGKRLALEVTAVAYDPNQPRQTVDVSAPTPVVADPPVIGGGAAGGGGGGATGGASSGGGGGGAVVVAAPIVKIAKPNVLRPGVRLSVPGSFAGFVSPRYRWLRNGTKIKRHSRKRVYRITRKDRGKRLACRITLTPVAGGANVVVRTKAVQIPRRRRAGR
jgi:hypothetical protein